MSEDLTQWMLRINAAFNRDGIEAVIDDYHPELEWHLPPQWLEDSVYTGHDGLRTLAALWTRNFDEYRWDIERIVDLGQRAVLLVYHRGRTKDEGVRVEQPLGLILQIRDDKIGRVDTFFSWPEALVAAGVED